VHSSQFGMFILRPSFFVVRTRPLSDTSFFVNGTVPDWMLVARQWVRYSVKLRDRVGIRNKVRNG